MGELRPEIIHAARRALYTRSLKAFVQAAWPVVDPDPFIDGWHVDALCAHLEAVADGRINRLLINIPPGTAKSMIAAVLFPAWLWTRDPALRIISTSYSQEHSTRDTRKSRDLITSDWYQGYWPVRLRDDQNQKTAFENVMKGARTAKPFASMTGSRANIVIVDDPHSVLSANSDLDRQTAVDTMLTAVPNRLNDLKRDAIVVIMQRLHEEDVSGVLLARELGYVHLCIPMEWEGDDSETAIGWRDPRTVEGQLLFPAKFPSNEIARLKSSLGPISYAGQYQQRPSPKDAGYFDRKWFKRFRPNERPKHLNIYMTSDHAPGGKGDFNVFRIWGVDKDRNLWLLDSFRNQCLMDVAMGVEIAKDGKTALRKTGALPLIRKWKPLCWFPERDGTWAAIKGLVVSWMQATDTPCRIEPLTTSGLGDKVNKAQGYQAKASTGQVYLPEGPVGDVALDEYVRFPNAKHDDQVDADGAMARVMNDAHPAFIPVVDLVEVPRGYRDGEARSKSDSESFF